MLKLVGKTSNQRSILHSPPADWSEARKVEHFGWAHEVVAGCRSVNPWFEARFDEAWEAGMANLVDSGAAGERNG